MYNPLRLTNTLHPDAGNGPHDTLAAKRVLAQLGYYEIPDYDLTPYPDFAMFDAIANFQRDIGLRADGVIGPYSPTETLLNEVLSFSMRDGAMPSAGGAPAAPAASSTSGLTSSTGAAAWSTSPTTSAPLPAGVATTTPRAEFPTNPCRPRKARSPTPASGEKMAINQEPFWTNG